MCDSIKRHFIWIRLQHDSLVPQMQFVVPFSFPLFFSYAWLATLTKKRSEDESVASIEAESQEDKQQESHLRKGITLSSCQQCEDKKFLFPSMVSGPSVPGASVAGFLWELLHLSKHISGQSQVQLLLCP